MYCRDAFLYVFNPSVFSKLHEGTHCPCIAPSNTNIAPSRVIRESHAGYGWLTGPGQVRRHSFPPSHNVFLILRVPLKDQRDLPEVASMGMEVLLLTYVYNPIFSCRFFDLQVKLILWLVSNELSMQFLDPPNRERRRSHLPRSCS